MRHKLVLTDDTYSDADLAAMDVLDRYRVLGRRRAIAELRDRTHRKTRGHFTAAIGQQSPSRVKPRSPVNDAAVNDIAGSAGSIPDAGLSLQARITALRNRQRMRPVEF